MYSSNRTWHWLVLTSVLAAAGGGCIHFRNPPADPPDVPHERKKMTLGEYVVESPDLLQIDLLNAVPKPPYKIQPLDVLSIKVEIPGEANPILAGMFQVDADGKVYLGKLGQTDLSVSVSGLSLPDAKAAVQKAAAQQLRDPPTVTLLLAEGRGVQLVRGQHLVRPDGTVSLGGYGSVMVSGLTVAAAKKSIEDLLGKTLLAPEVAVSVIGYNSKVYYIIFDFGGAGQQLVRLPVTGNDTILDAMSQVNGLTAVSDPRQVWVARSAGPGEPDEILPVDWAALTCRGRAETNYQLMPGDRIFVKAYPMVAADVFLGRILSPFERILGFSLLGSTSYQSVRASALGLTTGTIGP